MRLTNKFCRILAHWWQAIRVHGALGVVVATTGVLGTDHSMAQQFSWDGITFPSRVAAESAMRSAPKGADLRQYATYAGPPIEHHYYSPAFGEPILGTYGYYEPQLDPNGRCRAATTAEVLDCLGISATPLICRDASFANVPGEECDSGEGSHFSLVGGYTPSCFEPRNRLAFACADHSWGLQRTCSLDNARTTYLRCTTGRADVIFETEVPYRLQLSSVMQQTPSPRAAAAADRAIPLTVTMTRSKHNGRGNTGRHTQAHGQRKFCRHGGRTSTRRCAATARLVAARGLRHEPAAPRRQGCTRLAAIPAVSRGRGRGCAAALLRCYRVFG